VVVGLGLVWGVFQFRRALGVASHTNQIRDIPLYLVYQLGSGVLRTVGAYVGLVGWGPPDGWWKVRGTWVYV